jgi:hypothetical protein
MNKVHFEVQLFTVNETLEHILFLDEFGNRLVLERITSFVYLVLEQRVHLFVAGLFENFDESSQVGHRRFAL